MFLALFLVLVTLFVVLPVIGMPAWAVISTIIVGFVIGALGRLVVPGRQRVNMAVVFLSGLIGSIIGGFLGSHVFSLGWIGTTLVEIGVAAAVIAFMPARVPSPRPRPLAGGQALISSHRYFGGRGPQRKGARVGHHNGVAEDQVRAGQRALLG